MCNPTLAVTAIAGASSYIQFQQQKQAQKNEYARQKRQNDLAKKNAIQRYASEALRIRQVEKQSKAKGFTASLKADKARARFQVSSGSAGVAMSGSTLALMKDYYRTEGNYKNSLANNLNMNIRQFENNLEAIQFGQESQQTYLTPPNPELLFASNALNVANTYYSLEAQKELKGLKPNKGEPVA